MYIDPFWAGVLTTILAELSAIIVLALINGGKNHGDKQ